MGQRGLAALLHGRQKWFARLGQHKREIFLMLYTPGWAEDLIAGIKGADPVVGTELGQFYARCLHARIIFRTPGVGC